MHTPAHEHKSSCKQAVPTDSKLLKVTGLSIDDRNEDAEQNYEGDTRRDEPQEDMTARLHAFDAARHHRSRRGAAIRSEATSRLGRHPNGAEVSGSETCSPPTVRPARSTRRPHEDVPYALAAAAPSASRSACSVSLLNEVWMTSPGI